MAINKNNEKKCEENLCTYHVTQLCIFFFLQICYSMKIFCIFVNFRERLENGLAKLSEANELVGTYQDKLRHLGPLIETKQKV